MAISNKPIVWGPFAAGGHVTALITPVLVLLTLLVALGYMPAGLTYENLRAFSSHWLAKLVIFLVIALSLWSQAHRLRITFFDFGARADSLVATVMYLAAAIGTIAIAVILLQL